MSVIVLDATDETLKAVLGEAHDTSAVQFNTFWGDATSSGAALETGNTAIDSNGTTAVTLVGSPASSTKRDIVYGTVYNGDLVSHTVKVYVDYNGTPSYIGAAELASGASCSLADIIEGTVGLTNSGQKIRALFSNPQAIYSQRPQVFLDFTDAAITITSIKICGNDSSPTTELFGDLKHADDMIDGSFANSAVIDVCDTTNGEFSVTSGMDDPTVPASKFIYFQMDSSPHADWTDFLLIFKYTYD